MERQVSSYVWHPEVGLVTGENLEGVELALGSPAVASSRTETVPYILL